MSINKEISKRIEMLRFLMIFGVVLLHVPQYVPIEQMGDGVFNFVKVLFQHAVFRATVPVLTFISGYLLFSSGNDTNPLTMWKKKFTSLVVPFMFFNLTLLVLAYLAQVKFGVTMSYDLKNADFMTWMNAAFGVLENPINYPLNFVRDMVVLLVLAPVFGYVLRNNPFVGLLVVLLIFLNNMDGALVLRDSMAIQFYVGGLAAVTKVDMTALDKHAKLLLVIFAVACVALVKFQIANRNAFVLIAPLFVWPAASLLVNTKLGSWMAANAKYSFFVFIAHAPVVMASWMVYQKLSTVLPYALYWTVTPFATVAALMVTYKAFMFMMPSFFSVVTGGKRSYKKKEEKVFIMVPEEELSLELR
jgi:succinoglycan biosynthesis protein ExoH